MKHLKISILSALLVGLFAGAASAAVAVKIGSHVYAGLVRAEDGVVLGSTDKCKVQAVNSAGAVVAESDIQNTLPAGALNYRLAVSIATGAAQGCVQVGESLNCVVRDEENTVVYSSSTALPPVGAVAEVSKCNLVLGAGADGVSDEYREAMSARFAAAGKTWTPEGDDDGDGMTNRDEFLAGTDPLDAQSCLKVYALASVPPAPSASNAENADVAEDALASFFAVSFPYTAGRVYEVLTTDSLASGIWNAARFREEAKSSAGEKYLFQPPASAGDGVKTIYLTPGGSSRFYKVEVK